MASEPCVIGDLIGTWTGGLLRKVLGRSSELGRLLSEGKDLNERCGFIECHRVT